MSKRERARLKQQDVNGFAEEWQYVDTQNANADSKIGWSTAFFALILSSLLAIGLSVEHESTWLIMAPFMSLALMSVVLLVLAMNPNPKSRKIRNSSNVEMIKVLRAHAIWEENRIHWMEKDNELFEQAKNDFITKGIYKDNVKDEKGLAYPDWDTYFQEVHEDTVKRLIATFEINIKNYRKHIDHKLSLLGAAYLITFPFLLFHQIGILKEIFKNPYSELIFNEDMKKLKDDVELTRRQNFLLSSYIANKFGEEL